MDAERAVDQDWDLAGPRERQDAILPALFGLEANVVSAKWQARVFERESQGRMLHDE